MKVESGVVDTNVLISALLQPSGRTTEVLEPSARRAARSSSDETFEELASRLMRSKFTAMSIRRAAAVPV